MSQFTVSLFSGCNQTKPAVISGLSSSQIEFSPFELNQNQVKITSSSQTVGSINNKLTFAIQPAQRLPRKGTIIVKIPQWYKAASVQQGYSKELMSIDNMIELDSTLTLVSGGNNLVFTNSTIQLSSGAITISYENGLDNWKSDISFQVSQFKNPINYQPKSGFQLLLTDSIGVLCATTGSNSMVLQTKMTSSPPLQQASMQFLGDEEGKHIAQVGFENSLYLQMTSPIPLEPLCEVKIQLPKQLKIENISMIAGSGFFQHQGDQLTPNLYSVDLDLNTLIVKACLFPNQMTSSPLGSLTISSVRLPSFQQQSDPIQIQISTSNYINEVVVNNPIGPALRASEMVPGSIQMASFEPTDPRIFAVGVDYQISIILQSGFLSTSRMTVKLPQTLKFSDDCKVTVRAGDCKIDTKTNTIVLIDMTDVDWIPNILVSFTIYNGENPTRSQKVGKWFVFTEIMYQGKWYVQDRGEFDFSFEALAGNVDSELSIDNKQVWYGKTTYSFTSTCQHEIPLGGFLRVQLPEDCGFGDQVVVKGFKLEKINRIESQIFISVPNGAKKDTKLSYQITGIWNPRSLAPSQPFVISSLDSELYVIDQGEDVSVQMEEINFFESITFKPIDLTNGLVGTYIVEFNSFVEVKNDDMLIFTLPAEMRAVAEKVNCQPSNATRNNVINVTCMSTGNSLLVKYEKIGRSVGTFGILLHGIQNPPSFRKSNPIFDVQLNTKDNWPIQQAKNKEALFVQTSVVATITDYKQYQDSEEYGVDTALTLQFSPLNRLSSTSYITISWPTTVALYKDSKCQVTTSKEHTLPSSCQIDLNRQLITLQDIFDRPYSGTIKIFLSRVRNPITNRNPKSWLLQTYDEQYASDMLKFFSLTKCNFPCRYCGTEKNYCSECWPGDANTMLMRKGTTSTCQPKCESGWTSNGAQNSTGKLCVPCDSSCINCLDKGNVGDYQICLTCNPDFIYFEPNSRACMKQCAIGMYDIGRNPLGYRECGQCDSTCLECNGTAKNCISCNQDSKYTAFYQSQCLEKCPDGYGNKGGLCEPCESPCKTCAWDVDVCTSCDGSLNRTFTHGIGCVESCPNGTLTDLEQRRCIGCKPGCIRCNDTDQSQCLLCENALFLLDGECLIQCPPDYTTKDESRVCIPIVRMDVKVIYFPFLALMIAIAVVNCIGKMVKKKHKFLANFLVMMGFLEHIALISEVALCFAYGIHVAFGIVALSIWLCYFTGQFVFIHLFQRDSIKDKLLQEWMNQKRNQVANKIFKYLSYISWKCQKLLYSHFFNLQEKTADFSNPQVFQLLMHRMNLANIVTVYIPLIALNTAGLFTHVWGTQLFIMFIEGIVLGAAMIVIGTYEQFKLAPYIVSEHERRVNYVTVMKPLEEAFGEFQESIQKEQEKLLKQVLKQGLYSSMEFEKLIDLFGNRRCKSFEIPNRNNEPDPRKIRSYPMSPGLKSKPRVQVSDPPVPIWPNLPNNCIAVPKDNLKPLDGNGYNKACQAGKNAIDLKRADAALVSTNLLLLDVEFSSPIKKQRGRKNRFYAEIDTEDHNQALLQQKELEQLLAKESPVQDQDLSSAVYGQDSTSSLKAEIDEKIQGERLMAALQAMKAEDDAFYKEFSMRFEISEQEIARASGLDTQRNSDLKQFIQLETNPIIDLGRISTGDCVEHQRPKIPQTAQKKIYPVEVILPNSSERMFNENQILGQIKRDANGLKIIDVTNSCDFIDLEHKPVTKEGYLLNELGQVVSNIDGTTVMFPDLVEGELPAPFCLEKYNFSPWEILGQFDYSNSENPGSFFKAEANELRDLMDRRINLQGFLINEQGDLVKYNGERVLHKSQLENGLLPIMYNYDGVCFSIIDIMGVLEVFEGKPLFQRNHSQFIDKTGCFVNERGYLITKEGHVCNRKGQVLFKKQHLQCGDFPKIFAFSQFDKKKFQGDFQLDRRRQPIKNSSGKLIDKQDRRVNESGYLIDANGNVIDKGGNVLLEHSLLDSQGELPLVFLILQNNALENAEFQISDHIEADHVSIVEKLEDTSYDSEMADPISFNNQDKQLEDSVRLPTSQTPVYSEQQQVEQEKPALRKKRKNKSKDGVIKIKKYFEADIQMADAYGGVPKPRERLVQAVVSQRFATVARERPNLQPPKIQNLAQSITQQEARQKAKRDRIVKESGSAPEWVPKTAFNAKNSESIGTGIPSTTDDRVGNSMQQDRQREKERLKIMKLSKVEPTVFKKVARTIVDYGDRGNTPHRKNGVVRTIADYDDRGNTPLRKNDSDGLQSPSSQISLSSGGPYTLTEADPERQIKGLASFQQKRKNI